MPIAPDRRDEIGIRPDRCVAPSASSLGGDPPSGCAALLICVPRTGLFSDPPLTKIRSTRIPLEETWMSALAQPVVDVAADDHLARRNALVLAVTQALAGGNSTVLVATAGIVGTTLAPDKSLATLPISIYVLGTPEAVFVVRMFEKDVRVALRGAFVRLSSAKSSQITGGWFERPTVA